MIKANFIERKNRFVALIELDGEVVNAHVANSGRLRELFTPGREVYLVEKVGEHRATRYDLALVKYEGRFVSVDARVPNDIVSLAIDRGQLQEFRGYTILKREIKYGSSRLDMLAADDEGKKFFIEVKSVTLVKGEIARFPDAPTERGARHLEELSRAVREGHRGAVVFLVQRDDARQLSPNDDTDPVFGETLRRLTSTGVEAYAYICRVTPRDIGIIGRIPVVL